MANRILTQVVLPLLSIILITIGLFSVGLLPLNLPLGGLVSVTRQPENPSLISAESSPRNLPYYFLSSPATRLQRKKPPKLPCEPKLGRASYSGTCLTESERRHWRNNLATSHFLRRLPGFSKWCKILYNYQIRPNLPANATLFVPPNAAIYPKVYNNDGNYASNLIFYHILPQRLTFDDLSLLKPGSTLPTLLPSQNVVVSPSSDHVSIDNTAIIHPDVYLSCTLAVHCIKDLLPYTPSPPPTAYKAA